MKLVMGIGASGAWRDEGRQEVIKIETLGPNMSYLGHI